MGGLIRSINQPATDDDVRNFITSIAPPCATTWTNDSRTGWISPTPPTTLAAPLLGLSTPGPVGHRAHHQGTNSTIAGAPDIPEVVNEIALARAG
jgi:hypothetical protein